MRRVIQAFWLTGLVTACAAGQGSPGEPGPAHAYRSEIVTSEVVAAGTLSGVTVRADTGEPLRGVQVWVIGTSIGTLSGEDGSVHLRGLPDGEDLLLGVSMLGFRADTLPVRQRPGSGLAARLVMRPAPICLCNGSGFDADQGLFIIDVRDAVAGGPPVTAEVQVAWRGGEARDSQRAESKPHLMLSAGPAAEGRYRVAVRAPGYQPWTRDVLVERGCCGDLGHQRLTVWLLPLRRTGR